jgi:plasmid stabilization system protein ParE
VSELVFLFSADADIQTAFEFCEACQAGRGEVFMRYLDAAFGRLRIFPEIAPLFHESYRRLLVPGFPYGIFYTIEGRRIIVSGVMDLRQDPNLIRQRLRGRSAPE